MCIEESVTCTQSTMASFFNRSVVKCIVGLIVAYVAGALLILVASCKGATRVISLAITGQNHLPGDLSACNASYYSSINGFCSLGNRKCSDAGVSVQCNHQGHHKMFDEPPTLIRINLQTNLFLRFRLLSTL